MRCAPIKVLLLHLSLCAAAPFNDNLNKTQIANQDSEESFASEDHVRENFQGVHFHRRNKREETFSGTPSSTPGNCKVVAPGPDTGSTCIFPFTWSATGKTYYECAFEADMGDKYAWCSTKVDARGNHVIGGGHWGKCHPDNCPRPYNEALDACLHGHNDETVSDISLEECKQRCSSSTDFQCNSLEYLNTPNKWNKRYCYLSKETKETQTLDYQEPCSGDYATAIYLGKKSLKRPYNEAVDACLNGHNDETVSDISLEECKQRCSSSTDFQCNSLEYLNTPNNWNKRYCYLSKETKATQPLDYQVPCSGNYAKTIYLEKKPLTKIDFDLVRADLVHLMKDSQDFWPADYGNYGPLFVRLAWHSSGSYRTSDGRGGSDGARQRFEPERSWDDNTNLDKARKLLWPIKQKYGLGLSWGDLIVLSGNTAIETMGGPVLGFCGGRIDAPNGEESALLGPSSEQEAYIPCEESGSCEEPFGSNTLGLIYVNPEGPMGNPVPEETAPTIRDTFGRMNMNDSETVALIGGGHAFGKAHGACPDGPGPKPIEDSVNPWPGKCGTGKGEDTFTSGFEFPFSTKPTQWDNEYFQNLINFDWTKTIGPGGHFQWHVEGGGPLTYSASGTHKEEIGLLTSDVALSKDPSYLSIVEKYADDMEAFNHCFSHAWYKLTTRDMGPVSRCVGNNVPPPQSWQYPLPDPPKDIPNSLFENVKTEINSILTPETIGQLIRLSWQCSSTFRGTDYLGGCNGARIRFSPQKDWPVNINLDKALDLLRPIRDTFGEQLSWADLIILAGNAALERVGGRTMEFCGGRTDDSNGDGSEFLKPKIVGNFDETLLSLRDYIDLMTLSPREFAVLNGAGYAVGALSDCSGLFCSRQSYTNQQTEDEPVLSNIFFTRLLSHSWDDYTMAGTGQHIYKAAGEDLYMLKTDLMFKYDAELLTISQDYASDNQLFLDHFAAAWTKMANIDRFDGPMGNLCTK